MNFMLLNRKYNYAWIEVWLNVLENKLFEELHIQKFAKLYYIDL